MKQCVSVTVIIACSKRSDSGEWCGVKKAMKSKGGLWREVHLTSPPSSLLFFRSPFYFAPLGGLDSGEPPHYLNAWNRLLLSASAMIWLKTFTSNLIILIIPDITNTSSSDFFVAGQHIPCKSVAFVLIAPTHLECV